MSYENYYPFEPLPLAYAAEELKPSISEYTLYFHHDKHYKAYADKLNALLESRPLMQNVPLELLTRSDDADIRANAGGVYNHELYFSSLSPDGKAPSDKMLMLIKKCFGSEKELWDALVSAGLGIVGSGYVWLALNPEGRLEVAATAGQDTIDLDRFIPLFNIDVWEHAYYLDRQNLRAEYIKALENIIDWEHAEKMMNGQ